jgi:hypothetical protein
MDRWANPDWLKKHVILGPPVGKLPFKDKSFDIVYTAEVLVHVRPQDIEIILSELVRIARWQVLHIERNLNVNVVENEHDGCWNHDLPALYQRMGFDCQILPCGYSVHTPYRVVLDAQHSHYAWSPAMTGLWRRMEKDLLAGQMEINCIRQDLEFRIGQEIQQRNQIEQNLHAIEDAQGQEKYRATSMESEFHRILTASESQREELQGRLGHSEAQRVGLEEHIQRIEASYANEQERAETLARKLHDSDARQAAAIGQLEESQAQCDNLAVQLKQLQRKNEQLRIELETAQIEQATTVEALRQKTVSLAGIKSQKQSLDQQLGEDAELLMMERKHCGEIYTQLLSTEAQLRDLKKELACKDRELETTQDLARTLEHKLVETEKVMKETRDSSEAQIRTVQQQLQQAQETAAAEIAALERQQRANLAELKQAEQQLQATRLKYEKRASNPHAELLHEQSSAHIDDGGTPATSSQAALTQQIAKLRSDQFVQADAMAQQKAVTRVFLDTILSELR